MRDNRRGGRTYGLGQVDSYRITIEPRGPYLHVQVSGPNTVATIQRYAADIREACLRLHVFKVLVVVRLEGPPLSMLEVYKAVSDASQGAAELGMRAAYVEPNPDRSQDNLQIGESVARTRGIPVQTFRDEAAAEAWLLE